MGMLRYLVIGVLIQNNYGATIPIGLVIEGNRQTEISAVRFAVQFANANILSRDSLTVKIFTIQHDSTIETIQKTCDLISTGAVAQIGPARSSLVSVVAPYFDQLKIPLIAPVATSPLLKRFNYTMHLVPSDMEQGKAIASIMAKMLPPMALHFYQPGLHGLKTFLEIASTKAWHIASMQSFGSAIATPNTLSTHAFNYIATARITVKQSLLSALNCLIVILVVSITLIGFRVTILNCLGWQANYILNEANSKHMIGKGWLWIVTDKCNGNVLQNPPPVPDGVQGIIGIGFPTASGSLSREFQLNWTRLDPVLFPGAGTITLTTSIARWADAVFTVAYAVRDYGGTMVIPDRLSCIGGSSHPFGPTMLAEIQKVVQPGVAENIEFTATYPTDVKYEVYNSRLSGWIKVGTWDPHSLYQVVENETLRLPGNLSAAPDFVGHMNGKPFTIVTAFDEPFMFNITPPRDLNDMQVDTEVVGYGVDMIKVIARILNFSFTMYLVPDGNWGNKNISSGFWTGMVGELVTKKADFAVASLTINGVREKDIDFSTPFMDLGLQFAIPKDNVPPSIWEFMEPFHQSIWIATGLAMLIVGISIALFEKLSPYGFHGEFIQTHHQIERINSYRRDRQLFRRKKSNALGPMRTDNSVWFATASLVQQGCQEQPQAASSRLVAMVWWFGVLTLITTYTAPLGAMLIGSKLHGQINTVTELYAQDRVKYGFSKGTSIAHFFCENELSLYKNMCLQVRRWRSHTEGVEDALARLADSNNPFAFVSDSTLIGVITEKQPCNIRKLGEVFNKGGFGIGLQKGSPYTEILSQTILQLRENSFMAKLHETWFAQRTECAAENLVFAEAESSRKGYNDLKGVFYLFWMAAMISPCFLLVEFIFSCIEHHNIVSDTKVPMNFCAVLRYRFSRMRRHFYIYVIPETWKPILGLHEFTRNHLIYTKQHRVNL